MSNESAAVMADQLSFPYSCLAGYNISDYARELELRHRNDQFYQLYWLKIPLAALGFVLVAVFIAAIARSMREHRVGRKFYALILNRAFGDLTYMGFFLVGYAIWRGNADYQNRMATIILSTGSYWAAMVSYVMLSLLKLYGIANPLAYRHKVTMVKCVQLIVASWLAFLLLVGVAFTTEALLKVPSLRTWSGCTEQTCLAYVDRVVNGFIVAIYVITLVCYFATVCYIWRASKNTKRLTSVSQRGRSESTAAGSTRRRGGGSSLGIPLLKLSAHVATYAVLHLPHTLAGLFVAAASPRYKFTALICFAHTNFHLMQATLGLIGICIMVRIILDVLIGFALDREIRRGLIQLFGCSWRRKVRPAKGNPTELTHVGSSFYSSSVRK